MVIIQYIIYDKVVWKASVIAFFTATAATKPFPVNFSVFLSASYDPSHTYYKYYILRSIVDAMNIRNPHRTAHGFTEQLNT